MSNGENETYFETWLRFMRESTGLELTRESEPYLRTTRSAGDQDPWYYHHLTFAEGSVRIKFADARVASEPGDEYIKDDNDELFAIIRPSGILLICDPDSVEWCIQPDEGEARRHAAFTVLQPIEAFFKSWNDGLPDRLSGAFEKMRTVQLEKFRRRRQCLARDLEACQKNLKNLEESLRKNRRAAQLVFGTTLESFKEAAREWLKTPNAMKAVDRFVLSDDVTSLRTRAFHIEGVRLGPYNIELSHDDLSCVVLPTDDAETSHNDYHHPHVDQEGNICWGSDGAHYVKLQSSVNPIEILLGVLDFLQTSYYASGSYCRLEHWHEDEDEDDSYLCDYCEREGNDPERHADDETCPYWCSECETQLDISNHDTCWEHGCYDMEDGCHGCDEVERAAEEEREREREEEEREEAERERLEAEAEDAEEAITADTNGSIGPNDGPAEDSETDPESPETELEKLLAVLSAGNYDNSCSCSDCSRIRELGIAS